MSERDPDTIYLVGGDKPYCRVVRNGYRDQHGFGVTLEVLDDYAKRSGRIILTGSGTRQLEQILRRKRLPSKQSAVWDNIQRHELRSDL